MRLRLVVSLLSGLSLTVSCSSTGSPRPTTPTSTTLAGSITPGEVNGDIDSPRIAASLATLVVDGVIEDEGSAWVVRIMRVIRGSANVGDRLPVRPIDDPLLVPGGRKYLFIDFADEEGEVTFFTSSERAAERLAAGLDLGDRMSDDQIAEMIDDPRVELIVQGTIVADPDDDLRATVEDVRVIRADAPVPEGDFVVYRDHPSDDRPGGPWVFEVPDGSWNTGVRGVLFLGAATAEGRPVLNPTEPWLVDADRVVEALNR